MEALDELPPCLAVYAVRGDRKAGSFLGFDVATPGPVMSLNFLRKALPHLPERKPFPAFQLPEQIPLAGNLIITGHRTSVLTAP